MIPLASGFLQGFTDWHCYIHPVLAHPDRYIYMGDSDYGKLKQEGVRFQINLPSLAGFYGRETQRKAERLLAEGYVDLYGTDSRTKR